MEEETSLSDVQCFLAAARTLHFTRAARALGVAQPTLSLAIRRLEKSVGVPLFDRVGRQVRLTTAGEVYREQAAAAVGHLSRARRAVADLAGLRGGTLAVGVTHILAASLLPRALAAFHREHPGVALHAERLTSADVERRLLGELPLDLGITFTKPSSEELLAEELFTEKVVVAAPAGHVFARKKAVAFKELAGAPLALTTRDFATRRLVEATAAERGVRLEVGMEFNDVGLLLATVAAAGLATVVARRAVEAQGRTGLRLVPLVGPALSHRAHLLWHRDRYRTAAARRFAEVLRGELRR
jgi:LysR family cyn operon transcriptional activator